MADDKGRCKATFPDHREHRCVLAAGHEGKHALEQKDDVES